MSEYLLRIAYGPVQSFISASRKTRDLKAGSDLLVKLGGIMLDSISKWVKAYVFPSTKTAACANILEVVVTGDPKKLADQARSAAVEHLTNEATGLQKVHRHLAQQQAARFLEFYAVWTEADETAHATLDKLMAARKSVREFDQMPNDLSRINHPTVPGRHLFRPKSLLMPEFDSVLNYEQGRVFEIADQAKTIYSLKETEHLDALSLIKRRTNAPMPSTRTIAVADLPDILTDEARDIWDTVDSQLVDKGVDIGDWLADEMDDYTGDAQSLAALRLKRNGFLDAMKDVAGFRIRPYYAIIHADGDHMGRTLSALRSIAELRAFSGRLDNFAVEVRKRAPAYATVVFAGGDDVLAFTPMSKAFEFAKLIHKIFGDQMVGLNCAPTLSVGIAFVHVKENLSQAVAYSVTMEHHAKAIDQDKDAFSIGARTRGGSEVVYRDRWANAGRMEALFDFFRDQSGPRGFPYEVAQEAERLIAVGADDVITKAAYARLAEKKDGAVPALPPITGPQGLAAFAQAMKLAHFTTRSGEEG